MAKTILGNIGNPIKIIKISDLIDLKPGTWIEFKGKKELSDRLGKIENPIKVGNLDELRDVDHGKWVNINRRIELKDFHRDGEALTWAILLEYTLCIKGRHVFRNCYSETSFPYAKNKIGYFIKKSGESIPLAERYLRAIKNNS